MLLFGVQENPFSFPEPPPSSNSVWVHILLTLVVVIYFAKSAIFICKAFKAKRCIRFNNNDNDYFDLLVATIIFVVSTAALAFDCRDFLIYSSRFGVPAFEAITGDFSRSFRTFGYASLFSAALIILYLFKSILRRIRSKKSHTPAA